MIEAELRVHSKRLLVLVEADDLRQWLASIRGAAIVKVWVKRDGRPVQSWIFTKHISMVTDLEEANGLHDTGAA